MAWAVRGGAGGAEGEHAPTLLQVELYLVSNAALPAHAQRMRSLFASDKALVSCRVEWVLTERVACLLGGGRACGVATAQAACQEDPTAKVAGRARAERT